MSYNSSNSENSEESVIDYDSDDNIDDNYTCKNYEYVNRNDDQSEATETYPFGQDWEG
jgi:hypothetical protein